MSRLIALVLVSVVATDPAIAEPARFDQAGDPLPPGAVARIGTTRYRVRGWHQQVFLSPDGKTVLAKGEESVLKFFDAETGKDLGEIKDPDLFNWTADQSPDGKFLAIVGQVRTDQPPARLALRLYDLGTHKAVWTSYPADVQRSDTTQVRFTPDGKRLVTAGPDVRVWDAKNGEELLRQKLPVGYGGLDISPDGKTIAVGYYEVHVWDWESGAEPRKLDAGLRARGDNVRFSPDGKTLYVSGIESITKAIDLASGKVVGRLEAGPYARRVTFSPDGTRFAVEYHSTSDDLEGRVSIRDTASGAEIVRLSSGPDPAAGGCWSRDGTRYAAVSSYRVWVWDVKTGKPLGPDVAGHGAYITELAFNSDGRLFTASDDHTVRAWDSGTGKELLNLPMTGWVRGMAISQDGSLVAGSGLRNDLRVWDAKSGKEIFKLLGHGQSGGRLRRVRFSADDQRLVSFGDDSYLRVWDMLTGKLKAEHRFRPDDPLGGKGGDDEADERMEMIRGWQVVDLGSDGRTLVIGTGKDVRVLDTETGKERFKLEVDPGRVQQLSLSPHSKRLVTDGPGAALVQPKVGQRMERPKDFQVTVWDLTEAKSILKFRVPGSIFGGLLAFTPDGKRVVTGKTENSLAFWDAATGAAAGTIELPARPAHVAFDGAGKRVAIAFWDSTALVYDLAAVLKPATKE
jgi:WD40 repeat protein